MSCTDGGTGRRAKERKTLRNVAQDRGERANGDGLLFLGRDRAGGG